MTDIAVCSQSVWNGVSLPFLMPSQRDTKGRRSCLCCIHMKINNKVKCWKKSQLRIHLNWIECLGWSLSKSGKLPSRPVTVCRELLPSLLFIQAVSLIMGLADWHALWLEQLRVRCNSYNPTSSKVKYLLKFLFCIYIQTQNGQFWL